MPDVMADKPLESYGFLSDCHSAALVSSEGSIDWWCLPRFDSPSVFGGLLGPDAGSWRIAPTSAFDSEQRWIDDTLVLVTTMSTPGGRLQITDALALAPGARGHDIGLRSPHTLLRVVEVVSGTVEVDVEVSPRLEYGLTVPRWTRRDGRWHVRSGPVGLSLITDLDLTAASGSLTARVTGNKGKRWQFALAYDPPYGDAQDLAMSPSEAVVETAAAWRSWSALHTGYQGMFAREVRRSSLILQGLTYQKSGAVIAAATTSLPEKAGGDLNWDYRFAWLRDVSLTMQALWVGACPHEAGRFFEWLSSAIGELGDKPLQIVYGVEGERDLTEHELGHLPGWRGSRPVRVGNDAWKQRQLDVLGEVLFAARLLREQVEFTPSVRELLVALIAQAMRDWREPDAGMWESRDEPRHYTSSKVMCWVALDAGVDLAAELAADEDQVAKWSQTADEIRELVLREAWCESLASFAGALGSDELDVSVLLLPLVGFVPGTDPRMLSTIEAVRRELCDGWLVYRWKRDTSAFLIGSFWLIECLALAGQVDEAREGLQAMLQLPGASGLYAEEVEVDTHTMLGNLPQAFSHVGLINAAWRLSEASGDDDRGTPGEGVDER